MDSTEAAIAEDHHDIALAQQRIEPRHDRIGVRLVVGRNARGVDIGDHLLRVQAFLGGNLLQRGHLRDEDAIGRGERHGQVLLEDGAARGVAARLEKRPEPPVGELLPQAEQRLAHRGRVMAEVVDHGNAAHFPADFLATLHAGELRDRLRDRAQRNLVKWAAAIAIEALRTLKSPDIASVKSVSKSRKTCVFPRVRTS